jgi:hypothetical protein
MQLPDQSIFQSFPKQFRRWTWTPPALPDFAGPRELAELLISYRKRLADIREEGGRPEVSIGDLPEEALGPLLTVAYRASFLKEEGRPVQATLYSPPRPWHLDVEVEAPAFLPPGFARAMARRAWEAAESVRNAYRLHEPFPLDNPMHIARFAPTLALDDAVLVVRHEQGRLLCDGITLLDLKDAENPLLYMPGMWDRREGLSVKIIGPGELRVAEGRNEYTLRANELRVYRAAGLTEPVKRWFEELAKSLVESCSPDTAWAANPEGEHATEYAYIDVMILWSRVLRAAAQMRHGGAIIVVPDIASAPISLKCRLEPVDLLGELRQLRLALCRFWQSVHEADGDQVVERLEAKRCQAHKTRSASRSVGHLSATDGCVVLDRSLKVHGFGGSIKPREAPPKRCLHIEGRSQKEVEEATLLQPFGERHASAFNLCKQIPNTLAFVISQDGDLRVFNSDETTVYIYDLLYP